jgi:hypothetical protein
VPWATRGLSDLLRVRSAINVWSVKRLVMTGEGNDLRVKTLWALRGSAVG